MTYVTAERPRPSNTSQWVAEVIQREIFRGSLKPGDRIVEGRLAKELQVGISPVREGLQRLEYLGLVTRHINRGTFVTQLTPTEINQVFRLRAELETLSVKFALEAQNRSGLEELHECADQMMTASLEKDPARFFEWDLKFHNQVCRLAGCPFLEKCLRTLTTPLFAFVLIRLKQQPDLFDLITISRQHQQIADLFRLSDPAQAEKTMRRIMDGFRRTIVDTLYRGATPEGAT